MSQSDKGTGKMRIKVKKNPTTSALSPSSQTSSSSQATMSINGVSEPAKMVPQDVRTRYDGSRMKKMQQKDSCTQESEERDTTLAGTLSSLGLNERADDDYDDDNDKKNRHNTPVSNVEQPEEGSKDENREQGHKKVNLSTMLSTLDRALVQACRQERDRKWMLLVEKEFQELLQDANKRSLEYQSLTSYHRLILHRMCDWYGLQRQTLKNPTGGANTAEKQEQQRKGKTSSTHHGLRVFRGEASTLPSFTLSYFMGSCEEKQVVWEALGESDSPSLQQSSSSAGLRIASRSFVPKDREEHPAAIRYFGPADLQQSETAYNNGPTKKPQGFAATETTTPVRAALQERLERPGSAMNQGSIKIKQRSTAKSPSGEEDAEDKEDDNNKASKEGPAVVLRKEASYEEMRAKIFEKEELQPEEGDDHQPNEGVAIDGNQQPAMSAGGFAAEGMMYQPPQQAFPVHQNMQGMNQMYYPWMGFQGQPTYMSDSPYDMGVGEEGVAHQAPYYNHLSMQQHQSPYGATAPKECLGHFGLDMNQPPSSQRMPNTGSEGPLLWQPQFSESHTSSSA